MLRVRDIMTPDVVSIGPEATLREAIDTLVSCKIGGMPVVNRGKILGVISANDLLEFESVTPMTIRLQESAEPDDEEQTEPAEEWDESLEEEPSTFFTEMWPEEGSDIVERFAATEGPEWDFLSEHTVSEAMTRSVCTVSEGFEVSAAAARMLAAGVHRALVLEEGEFTGILTTTDILRAVAEHRLTVRQFVFQENEKS